VLLGRFSWAPGLRWIILAACLVAAALLLIPARTLGRAGLVAAAVAVAVLGAGAGSAAWGVSSAGVPQTSSSPTAGPAGVATSGGFAGGGGPGDAAAGDDVGGGQQPGAQDGSAAGGGFTGDDNQTVDTALVTLLHTTDTRWAAAANGSMQAAPLQLASGKAVMSIGGFTGSDPAPTLAQFQQYVAAGQIHYYISTGQGGGGARGTGVRRTRPTSVAASRPPMTAPLRGRW
jgi:hypothetical protein